MARLENYTMYAKGRSFAGSLVAVKGQGNAGPEVDSAVKRDLVNMRTFHMACDCCSKKGRLPACFSRVFGLEVAPFVMVRDQNHNEIELAVEKKNGKVYFADGWEILQRFYKLFGGTWITIVYANRHLFLLEIRNFTL